MRRRSLGMLGGHGQVGVVEQWLDELEVDEVADARVVAPVECLGAGVGLLGDEVGEADDGDVVGGWQAERGEVERLDLVDVEEWACLGRCDLERDRSPTAPAASRAGRRLASWRSS